VLDTGAPVVPIAIQGSAKIRNWKRLRFPRVHVYFGEPMRFEPAPGAGRERQQEIADAVFAEIRALYRGARAADDAGAGDTPVVGSAA
jgi:1-acyl-sn-glycerol-3-phosphate acyltransferase